jgi:disulfide oxidoreductase YuzD
MPKTKTVRFGEIEEIDFDFQDVHEVEAAVFSCLDPRFLGAVFKYYAEKGIPVDLFTFPGNMSLVGLRHQHPDMQKDMLDWIAAMKKAHHAKRFVYLFHGQICGAYKLAPKFHELAEKGVNAEELQQGIIQAQMDDVVYLQELLEQRFPGVPLEFRYLDPTPDRKKMKFTQMYTEAALEAAA